MNTQRTRQRGSGLLITAGTTNGVKVDVARRLRRDMTPAERLFWEHVRRRTYPGFRFRRQQPICGFVVDFYCDALAAVIEIDGGIHETQREYDADRDLILTRRGIRVLRFTNEEVLTNVHDVIKRIFAAARVTPSPLGEGSGPSDASGGEGCQ